MVNKKIILSVLVIGCIATVAGAGTWAYFDDTKESENGQITTGTIELTPGADTLKSFTIANIVPGNTETIKEVQLSNTGNVKGYLYAEIATTNEDKVKDLTTSIGKSGDMHEMHDGKKIFLGTLAADGSVQTYIIKYNFAETEKSQKDQMKQTVTYKINYHLQQLPDGNDGNDGK